MADSSIELHRQIRGLFALLRVLIRRGIERRESIEDYAAHLETRVDALARVQEVLMRAPATGADLEELVHEEFLRQGGEPESYRVIGPKVRLAAATAAPLALAIHELIFNAFTRGVLAGGRSRNGCVRIEWKLRRRSGNDWLCIRWSESGGSAPVMPPARKGFGLELMEQMLPYELNARTVFGFHETGVRMLMMVPRSSGGRPPAWALEPLAERAGEWR